MSDKAIPVNWHDEFLRAEAALSESEKSENILIAKVAQLQAALKLFQDRCACGTDYDQPAALHEAKGE